MKARVQELLQIGDQLFSKRMPLLTLWQTFAENFYPLRADMTRVRYISEEFASYLMTGEPVMAHRDLADQLGAILRPRNMQWFQASTGMDSIDKDPACKRWLEQVSAVMRRAMYDGKTQFTRATKEGDADYILFGQCIIEPKINEDRTGPHFTTWHPRDCVWAENSDGEIDQFHRKWKPTVRVLLKYCKRYGLKPHPEVLKKGTGQDLFTEVNCRVIVLPADEYDSLTGPGLKTAQERRQGNHKFTRIIVDEDNQFIMEEAPQIDLGPVIPRWHTIGGFSQYAYSPIAVVALPDVRMLQQMTLTFLEIHQKSVDPPMLAVGDVIVGGTNLYAGGITWVDPDYDERTGEALRPMQIDRSGIQSAENYYERVAKLIQNAFYLNVLNLPPVEAGEKMTATEVQARMKEYIQRATPLFEPMDLEYNGQLCNRTFLMLERMGAFGSMWDRPAKLRGQKIEFKFNNPLVQAEDELKLISFTKVGQMLGAAVEFTGDQTLLADFDADTAVRDVWPGTGAPATWLRTKDAADAIKNQARQQQQQTQAANQLGTLAENGGKAAAAVQNVGQAASALQDAGLSG